MTLIFLCGTSPGSAQDQAAPAVVTERAAAQSQPQSGQPEHKQSDGIRKIAAKDAIQHAGETLAVCGKVASGAYDRRSQQKNTYLNFDKPYPDNTFTATIQRRNRKHFDYKPEELEGEFICVYGLVTVFRGMPEIDVVIPKQIARVNTAK